MAQVSGIAASLDSRLKSAVKAHCLDIDMLAARTLAEGVLRHWHCGLGPSPVELKGGILFDQRIRPTSDADITAIRSYMPHEFNRGMLTIRSLLHTEGMDIDFVSDVPKIIDTGYGEPVERWIVHGSVGGVRANTQIDISVGRGRDAFSRASEMTEIPSLVSRLPALTIVCQSPEAAAAEKLLAVICQSETDMRVKNLADILDERLWDGVDCGLVARELQRVCRHRGIDPVELPDVLDGGRYERLREPWTKHASAVTALPFDKAIGNANFLWCEVQDCMSPALRPTPPVEYALTRAGGMR